jgi:hypothetical protein
MPIVLIMPPAARGDDAAATTTTTVIYNSDGCRRGFRRGALAPYASATMLMAAGLGCSPCPGGVDCATGRECGEGTLALPASGRCCLRNMTCPHGRVLDNTECLCAPLGCAMADEWLLLLPQAQPQMACRSPLDHPISAECQAEARCGSTQALDPTTCACLAVRDCRKPSALHHHHQSHLPKIWEDGGGQHQ